MKRRQLKLIIIRKRKITYSLEIKAQNLEINRLNNDGKSMLSLKTYKSGKSAKSDNKSLDEYSIDSTNKSEDHKMEKKKNLW